MRKVLPLLLAVICSLPAIAQQSRHFIFHYEFSVRNLDPNQKLEIWFPQAQSDDFQTVRVLAAGGDLPLKVTRESRFGNSMYHAISERAEKEEYHFDVSYDVVRRERVALPRGGIQPVVLKSTAAQMDLFMAPDRLVPTQGRLADLAAAQVKGKATTLDRARAIYDYVFTTMKYDKSGTGWGRGDSEWACDSKRGNCTDFHSLFISMARSQHIPARFAIGFPIPAGKQGGDIAGYHCWADFYDTHYGWVPVDISEAWKDPSKKDYFFGAHDVNRVQFSVGRDLVLSPKQSGEPLNYFVYPYVEVNGNPWSNVENKFSFADASPAQSASR